MLSLAGALITGVKDYFIGRQEIKKEKLKGEVEVMKAETEAKVAISKAKAAMAQRGQVQDYDLDKMAMENMKTSYKDEYLLGLFSIPMILAFIPGVADVALAGFNVIKAMPEWYQYTFIGMIVVVFGMRGMLTKLLNGKFGIKPGKSL